MSNTMLDIIFRDMGECEDVIDSFVEKRRDKICREVSSIDDSVSEDEVYKVVLEIENHSVENLTDQVEKHGEEYVRVVAQNGFLDRLSEELDNE